MRKTTFIAGLLLCLQFGASAQSTNPAPYCTSEFQYNYNMWDSLKIEGYAMQFGTKGDYGNQNDYAYYNNLTLPDLAQGSTVNVRLRPFASSDYEPRYFALWIDFDHSDSFEPGELVLENANTTQADLPTYSDPVNTIVASFTVPSNAQTGITRMRLMRSQNDSDVYGNYDNTFHLNPCVVSGNYNFGCTYDFDVNIIAGGGTASINEAKLTSENLLISPNPVSNMLHLELENAQINRIKVYSINGSLVKEMNNLHNNKCQIPTSILESGVYLIYCQDSNGKISIQKFVKK